MNIKNTNNSFLFTLDQITEYEISFVFLRPYSKEKPEKKVN